MMLEPYAECGGVTVGITISKYVSGGSILCSWWSNSQPSFDAAFYETKEKNNSHYIGCKNSIEVVRTECDLIA